jgi:hypothetical protein
MGKLNFQTGRITMSKIDTRVIVGTVVVSVAGIGALLTGFIFDRTRTHAEAMAETERLKNMPDSYWEAEKAKADASVKKHQVDVAAKERLTIDERERMDANRSAIREFELNAPAGYWESKRYEAELKARRDESERRAKTEQEKARIQAAAIANATKNIGTALKNGE